MSCSTFNTNNIDEASPFPDGQPHIKINSTDGSIDCRINTPEDLFKVAQAIDILNHKGVKYPNLMIWHLMGARMDRRLSDNEPYTLKVICDIINTFAVDTVTVFCPHSKSTSDLLDNYEEFDIRKEAIFFDTCILKFLQINFETINKFGQLSSEVRNLCRQKPLSIVFPDMGAIKRFSNSPLLSWWQDASIVIMDKDRDKRTGKINGIEIVKGNVNDNCIIIDDLCDGGRTFVEAARVLRNKGALKIGLSVAHGVFSKGVHLEGLDFVSSSNSYSDITTRLEFHQVKVW